MKVLEANGVEVVIPDQRCCGIALITMGAEKKVRADAERNVRTLIPLVDRDSRWSRAPLVRARAHRGLPRLLGTEEARRLADHTIDVHQYLCALHDRGAEHLVPGGPAHRRLPQRLPLGGAGDDRGRSGCG